MAEAILGDGRFFRRSGPYPLAVVASTAHGVADELELLLEGVAPLQTAGPHEVSFLDNRRYTSALDHTSAGAVIVHPDMAARVPRNTAAILTTEPYAGWARVAALFYPAPPVCPGIHRSAIVKIDKIKEMQPWFHGEYRILLTNGKQLTLSRNYRANLQEAVGNAL